jgi:hypothetical protein
MIDEPRYKEEIFTKIMSILIAIFSVVYLIVLIKQSLIGG